MKKGIFRIMSVLFFVLLATTIYAQKTYTPEEAKDHIGEIVIIKGEVSQVTTTRAGQVYFNMGGKYPQNKFSAVILKTNVSKFDSVKTYEGKIIEVTGKVKMYNSKPEILIEKKRANNN